MTKKHPSSAQLRLWLARIHSDRANGIPIEKIADTFREMVNSWEAVEENAVYAAGQVNSGR